MADYYTPTVIDPMIPLAAMLPIERMFLAQVFAGMRSRRGEPSIVVGHAVLRQ